MPLICAELATKSRLNEAYLRALAGDDLVRDLLCHAQALLEKSEEAISELERKEEQYEDLVAESLESEREIDKLEEKMSEQKEEHEEEILSLKAEHDGIVQHLQDQIATLSRLSNPP